MDIITIILLSYLCGSIPFGLILIKLFKKTDIRAHGSGNIGATNAVRVGGKFIGALTFILDAFKGVLAIYLAKIIMNNYEYEWLLYNAMLSASALVAVLGHMFPIWLKFKGGKGVATAIACITYLDPFLGLLGILVWNLTFSASRISAIAALVMMILMTIASILISKISITALMLTLTPLIIIKHIPNLRRIKEGKELKMRK
ncbi:MAG: uncharacterized protein K0R73_232 [Candidatus Midichloriaceae bacterium]|jgi:glycerol-3-phosphate acyltransferase PlsY|nr:uncharacterized protein [Candidatus Midichloriaceae bacterium]